MKTYAILLKEFLERKFTEDGKVLPQEFHEAPVVLYTEDEVDAIRSVVRSDLKKKEEFIMVDVIKQLEAENKMIKDQMR